jgi:hypothetical protein
VSCRFCTGPTEMGLVDCHACWELVRRASVFQFSRLARTELGREKLRDIIVDANEALNSRPSIESCQAQ